MAAVCENRVSGAVQAALLLSLLSPPLMGLLGAVPEGVLGGVFLYLGFAGLAGNGVVARLLRVIRGRAGWGGEKAPTRAAVVMVGAQVVLVGGIFGVTLTPAGLVFPLLIVGLLPLRRFALPWALGKDEVEAEDPEDWGQGVAAAGEEGAAGAVLAPAAAGGGRE